MRKHIDRDIYSENIGVAPLVLPPNGGFTPAGLGAEIGLVLVSRICRILPRALAALSPATVSDD